MKILLVTPIYGRPEITEIWAKNLWIKDVLCVLSWEDPHFEANFSVIKRYGINAIQWKNYPLGEKMNRLIEYSLNFDYDYLMNLDSDGILHKSILDLYEPYWEDEFFGVDKVYFIDKKTGQTRLSKPNFWCSGRVISRKIIEFLLKNRENLYYGEDNRGLDARSCEKVERLTFRAYKQVETEDFPYVLDIKTWHSLNDFYFIEDLSEPCDDKIIKDNYSAKTIKMIYNESK